MTTFEDHSRSSRSMYLLSHLTSILAMICFVGAAVTFWSSTEQASVASTAIVPSFQLQPIETIRIGQRVVGTNPLTEQTQPISAIDPSTWKVVHLVSTEMTPPHEYEFLRSAEWMQANQAFVGNVIELDMFELGVEFIKMRVTAIEPCPQIESDDGSGRRVVTGLMKHDAENILDITIDGEKVPLGATDLHPFWSVDRQTFVKAGDLKVGERVDRLDGTFSQIVAISPHRGPPKMVYNLEVDGHHVYRVGDSGLLVHNGCGVSQYVFDARTGQYHESATRRFASADNLPWPQNNGFVESSQASMRPGAIVDRFGSSRGRYLGEPGTSISKRGLPPGSEGRPYAQYRVLKPFDVKVGTIGPVPEFAAEGGGFQFLPDNSVEWLVNNGFLEVIP